MDGKYSEMTYTMAEKAIEAKDAEIRAEIERRGRELWVATVFPTKEIRYLLLAPVLDLSGSEILVGSRAELGLNSNASAWEVNLIDWLDELVVPVTTIEMIVFDDAPLTLEEAVLLQEFLEEKVEVLDTIVRALMARQVAKDEEATKSQG